MKLATYCDDSGQQRIAAVVLEDQQLLDLATAHQLHNGCEYPAFQSMLTLMDAGDEAFATIGELIAMVEHGRLSAALTAITGCRLCSPVPVPRQIRACVAFEQHLLNGRRYMFQERAKSAPDPAAAMQKFAQDGALNIPPVWYERPLHYITSHLNVIGHDEDVQWPKHSDWMDYELEFGVFIGRQGKDIAVEEAGQYIFGYSIFNDMSARTLQAKEMSGPFGPQKSKNFDTGNIIGPWIVTADEVDPIQGLEMVARLNGIETSRGNSADMYYNFQQIIASISADETLYPGEFIASGTVGSGSLLETGRRLENGDIIELEIEGLGVLRNRLVKVP